MTLRLFPSASLSLIFVLTYQSIADELYAMHDKSVDSSAVLTAHGVVCSRILADVKAAGFTSVLVSIADQKNLQSSPMVQYETILKIAYFLVLYVCSILFFLSLFFRTWPVMRV